MKLGCCYFPEHWPEAIWAEDAARMRAMGLSLVRIGEFAWSRIEPEPGRFDWGWLDRAIDTLAGAGLEIVLCTPTATPPKWLVDQMPDMVAIDADGRPRGFGSRRHYCFSHLGYRAEGRRITTAIARRYGRHPAITGWQTDNEYGCHDTVLSFSAAAAEAFRVWLQERYRTIEALNAAWGNVFWSMEYRGFDEIDPPNLTVTEANPAHWLDYHRFASDEVVSFNREQADILREASPGRDITHNFMGFFTEFDHHALGADLDVATWDSYPLGFLEQFWFDEATKRTYLRQGHPDIAAFHHDLYRGTTKGGRWAVMEQQPGPVNWARFNPAPLPGMVALWTLEAYAHGAEFTSYFRWRQAPFAQEQMHAGLLRPDGSEAEAAPEVRAAAEAIAALGPGGVGAETAPAQAALVFSYQAAWVCGIQPQGESFRYLELAFEWYSALRQQGLDVDIVAPGADLSAYAMVFVPSLPILPEGFARKLAALEAPVLIGPRTGSKTANFRIPEGLPPGDLRNVLPITITRVESLRDGIEEPCGPGAITRWREDVEGGLRPDLASGARGVLWREGHLRYLAGWPDTALLGEVIERMAREAQVELIALPEGLRVRRTAGHVLAFNYSDSAINAAGLARGAPVIGDRVIGPAGFAAWRRT
ncbi:MAG: beta-galactosidase [Erythrobacter sp.]|nr:beta-galactosidase [Erythrobacter sp.]